MTDGYCFAKTIAYWLPSITESPWYFKATALDPSQRFTRMRGLFNELEKVLLNLFSPTTETIDPVPKLELKETDSQQESRSTGGLVLKHSLEIKVEPLNRGE